MSNIRHNNSISDAEIIKNIAFAFNRSIVMMAKDMGEQKGTLYQITTGRNNISARIKAILLETYTNLNPDYVEYASEPIKLNTKPQVDDAFAEEVFMQLAKLDKKMSILNDKLGSLIVALAKKE